MARTVINPVIPPGTQPALPLAAGSAALPFVPGDIVNFNATPSTGRELLVVQSSDAGAQTVTVSSAPDAQGRLGDITAYSIPAGAFAVLGPFKPSGWKQPDGNLYYQVSAVTLKIAVIQLPPLP